MIEDQNMPRASQVYASPVGRSHDLREFKPTMEAMMNNDEIRIVEVIASDYAGLSAGGLAEDLKLGFGALLAHDSAFKRIAVVSDKEWIAHTLHALAWMVPGEIASFGLDELDSAKEWAAGPVSAANRSDGTFSQTRPGMG